MNNYTKTVQPFQYWFGSISFRGHLPWRSTCVPGCTSIRIQPTLLENTTKLIHRAKMLILYSRLFTCHSNTSTMEHSTKYTSVAKRMLGIFTKVL